MSDPCVLLVGLGLNERERAESLELLRRVKFPNSINYLVTTGKSDTEERAKTFNVESGYPGEPALLQTLAAWAEISPLEDPRPRDGYDLFCLRSVLQRKGSFDYVLLARNAAGLEQGWPELLSDLGEALFLIFGKGAGARSNLLLRTADERTPVLVELAWNLYVTGAVYGMEPYELDNVLLTAADALRFAQELE